MKFASKGIHTPDLGSFRTLEVRRCPFFPSSGSHSGPLVGCHPNMIKTYHRGITRISTAFVDYLPTSHRLCVPESDPRSAEARTCRRKSLVVGTSALLLRKTKKKESALRQAVARWCSSNRETDTERRSDPSEHRPVYPAGERTRGISV